MTGIFLLDWSTLAISLFNASLVIWLGLTVALNAERPQRGPGAGRAGAGWGTALIAVSLLLGGLFFIAHSALLNYDLNTVSQGLNFWWHLGWWPVIALPLAWYVLVLWYSGYWDDARTALHRRHRFGPWLGGVGLLLLVGLVLFANPLPALGPSVRPSPSALLEIGGLPLLALAYPAYILVCMSLALDALLRPGPTGRMLDDLARRRARPWLASGSALLVLVSLLVGWAIVWVFRRLNADPTQPLRIDAGVARTIGWADLTIGGLIAVAAVMLGQALVAYEVFTGKTLPRRGLLRYWGNALVLAAGYGLVAGWSLALHLRPIYIVLLSTGLLSVFYALFSWRSYAERERYMLQLRPFVASQRLYDHLWNKPRPGQAPRLRPAARQFPLARHRTPLLPPRFARCAVTCSTRVWPTWWRWGRRRRWSGRRWSTWLPANHRPAWRRLLRRPPTAARPSWRWTCPRRPGCIGPFYCAASGAQPWVMG